MEQEKQLNSAESIAIIERMIAATRSKYEKGGGTILLIWGYVSLLVTALVTALLHLELGYQMNWLFFLIPIIGYTLMWFYTRKRNKPVTTYVDKFIGNVWMIVGSVAAVMPLLMLIPASVETFHFIARSIIPVEALILSIAVTLTGLTISFKPLVYCGLLSVVIALALFYVGNNAYIFMLLFVVSMIIPGHILNHRWRCSKS